ncbi:MAG: transport permease protein [Rickettsiales bacterium]|jgi:ABC-2 type transport system permease protein|nr:transport permease protein [Rickettsiales bacterium]
MQMRGFNTLGLWTVYTKEVRRFLKVYNQTLVAPMTTALLFLAIFSLAVGGHVDYVGGLSFPVFMASGLMMMSVMQNAFANTSSSFTMGKVLGTMVDYLMPPLSPFEITLGMVAAAVTRGVIVGVLVGCAVRIFVPFSIVHPLVALFFLIGASLMLALLGMLAGIFAETFDQMAAVTSYIVTPLAFLSGTFYSVRNLPDFWYHVSHMNPFFYMLDGFRYGITGYADGSIQIGIAYILIVNLLLWAAVHVLLTKGYRIKT